MKNSIKLILLILCGIFFGVFLFSGYKIYTTLHEYKVAEQKYDSISGQFTSRKESRDAGTPDAYDPLANEETSPISVDFEQLKETSLDVVGWIWSENTVINYPVVQAEDNDFYLHRFIDGSYNSGGSIFVDCKCAADFSDQNTVIYGHHMNDGSMFQSLRNYRNNGYFEEHPKMYLNTPTQNYRIEIFAGYVTDADSDTYTIRFSDEDSFVDYIQRMRAQSNFVSEVEVGPEDRIVTLSTCSYEYYDARYVIQGKLVPIN